MKILILVVIIVSYFLANILQNNLSDSLEGRIYPANLFQMTWMILAIIVFSIIGTIDGGLGFSKFTMVMGGFAGICNVLGGLCLLGALATGPLSITILIFSMYVVVPPLLAMVFLNEQATKAQLIGMVLIIVVLFISNLGKERTEEKKGRFWWLLCIGSVLGIGLSSYFMKLHQYRLPDQEIWEYSICNYCMGALLAFLAFCYFRNRDRKKQSTPYHFSLRSFFGPAIGMAVSEGVANLGNLYNASRIPAIVLYPVTQLGTLMMTVLFGVFFLKEKLTRNSVICLTLGMIAIVLMNF